MAGAAAGAYRDFRLTLCRLAGRFLSEELYASGYDDEALGHWAARVRSWSAGCRPNDAKLIDPDHRPPRTAGDVYVYFDKDAKIRAPRDAQSLRARLGKSARQ